MVLFRSAMIKMRLFCVQYLTRPSNTNKNFPYHISTNQVRIYLVTQLSTVLFYERRISLKILGLIVVYSIYTVNQKNKTPNSCPQLHQMLTDFQNSFTAGLSRKFVTKSYLNTSPHPKHVATLPCEISVFKNRYS